MILWCCDRIGLFLQYGQFPRQNICFFNLQQDFTQRLPFFYSANYPTPHLYKRLSMQKERMNGWQGDPWVIYE